ncbi:hypothetical protein SR39_25125 [Methylobacterium radiotolerans]|jgi:hypothetical protein|nr:hypothetical protein SR39_25125 [Methylobacterium radiotolerans]
MAHHPFLDADSAISCQHLPLRSIRLTSIREDEVDLFEGYLHGLLSDKAPDILAWLTENDAGYPTIFYSVNRKTKFAELNLMIAFHSENDAVAFRLVFM